METDDALCTALLARDGRFDGRFFVGVTSTGIYCRPVCRVRTPRRRNCRFFGKAAAAEAAGFGSLRRFNELFLAQYGLVPSALRGDRRPNARRACANADATEAGSCFELGYRPPFDWSRFAAFLAARAIPGVESVVEGCYRRSVSIPNGRVSAPGWLEVSAAKDCPVVRARLARALIPVLPQVLAAVRRLCDLACDPTAVLEVLGPLAADAPGLRIPGAFDPFEMSVRAVLGQQIAVRAAHTLAGRLAARFGTPMATPWPGVEHGFPAPAQLAVLAPRELGALGIVSARARAIVALARALDSGALDLALSTDRAATLAALEALPGIGRWTAQYIALRALSWPDAWFEVQCHAPSLTPDGQESPQDPLLRATGAQFDAWFAGKHQAFDLPLAPAGTDFQRQVWQATAQLPFGATSTYGAVARSLGRVAAARAAGAAAGRNPLSIIVPCHRLVAGNGALTGYAGGLARKAALLKFEAGEAGALGDENSCA